MRNGITKEDLLLEEWKTASELHRHMNDMIWQRFRHFVTVNGVLLSALAVSWSGITPNSAPTQSTLSFASAVLSAFGLDFSIVWLFIQIRGDMYQRYRFAQARRAEEQLIVDNERVLTLYENPLDEQELISVSRFARFPTLSLTLGIILPLSVAWLIAMVYFLILWL
jgi:hypothetical protein